MPSDRLPPLHRPLAIIVGLFLSGCSASSFDLGQRALLDGNPSLAASHFDEALAVEESVFRSTRGRGEAHLLLGETESALTDLESAREMRPDDPTVLHLLGQAYEAADRPLDAMNAYQDYGLVTDERAVQRLVRRKWADLRLDYVARDAGRIHDLVQRGSYEPSANSIAVYAFVPEDASSVEDQELCRALTVFVVDDLANVGALELVAADKLDAIYEYLDYTYENRQFFDQASLVTPGNHFLARHMVRGLFAQTPDRRIVIDVEHTDAVTRTPREYASATGKLDDFFHVQAEVVFGLLESMNVPVTPAEEKLILQRPTRDLTALTAFAHGLYLQERGDLQGASSAYQYAASIDSGFLLASQAADLVESEMVGEPVGAIPAPRKSSAAADRATRSSAQLGLGLIPDDDRGQAVSATTENNTAVHGTVTVSVVGTIEGGS